SCQQHQLLEPEDNRRLRFTRTQTELPTRRPSRILRYWDAFGKEDSVLAGPRSAPTAARNRALMARASRSSILSGSSCGRSGSDGAKSAPGAVQSHSAVAASARRSEESSYHRERTRCGSSPVRSSVI